MRVGMVLLIVIMLPGCTFNFVRKSSGPEHSAQQISYFKWLYDKGFYRTDPEIMRAAMSKLLGVGIKEQEEERPSAELLERAVRRLETELDRHAKDKDADKDKDKEKDKDKH
jgi:hypothetical protein